MGRNNSLSGVTLHTRLTCSPHIDEVKKRVAESLGMLGPLLNKKSDLSVRNGVLLYKQLIRPMMDYECPAWRSAARTHLRRLHVLGSNWNVTAHGEVREGKWRGNWRIEWVASTLYITSEQLCGLLLADPSYSSYLPAYEDETECPENLAYKIQTPGNYPEESIKHSEHGKSLKSRMLNSYCISTTTTVTRTRLSCKLYVQHPSCQS